MKQLNNEAMKGGFTLVEALVSVAIFSMAVTAVVGSFLAILRISEKSRSIRLVEQNARFLSEFLTREIRNGSIDYSSYSTVSNPEDELYLINVDGEAELISLSSGSMRLTKAGFSDSDLSSSDITVSDLDFYISPNSDPFCPAPCPDAQPRVTYTFTLTSNTSLREADQTSMRVQGTVSSRQYPD